MAGRSRRRARVEFSGQPYGARKEQRELNAAASAAEGAAAPFGGGVPGTSMGGGGGGGTSGAPRDPAAMLAALQAEDSTPIQPSTSNGPMTAGLPIGPGPGTEVLPPRALASTPQQGPRVDTEMFAAQMPMLEILANSPTASTEMRVWYRRLRSQMPVDVHVMPAGSGR